MKSNFILLAAGKSSRMGQSKAFLDFYGKPWIIKQIEEIQKSQVVSKIYLVVSILELAQFQKHLENFSDVQLVENANSDSKPSDSIVLALSKLKNQDLAAQGCFISPVDVPIKAKILRELAPKEKKGILVQKPTLSGKTGHPVWLSSDLLPKLSELGIRLDEFLQGYLEKTKLIEVQDELVLMNLNTPDRWSEFLIKVKASADPI